MPLTLYALHGFLGLPSDWDAMRERVFGSFVALKNETFSPPIEGLERWGQAFNSWVAKQCAEKRILLGYSQGGRLAMHALLDAPELWSGAIIVSADTGIAHIEERGPRNQVDLRWAQRFLNDSWGKLVDDWNSQRVFHGEKPTFAREEFDFDRKLLADAITGWSVGKQADLKGDISKLPFPILWVAGEKDRKYVAIAKEMTSLHRLSRSWIAPRVGHRVPWECPSLFLDEINSWMCSI